MKHILNFLMAHQNKFKNAKILWKKHNKNHEAVDLFTSAKRSSMANRSLCSLKAFAAKAPVAADTAPTAKPPPAKAALPQPWGIWMTLDVDFHPFFASFWFHLLDHVRSLNDT